MNRNRLITIMTCIMVIFASSCVKDNGEETPVDPVVPEQPEKPEVPEVPEEPEKPDPKRYPKGIIVSEETFEHENGKKTRYFVAKLDFKSNPDLKFNVLLNRPKKTPSKNYSEFDFKEEIPYIICNGGYFSATTSMSLVTIKGFCEVVAPVSMSWPNMEHPKHTIYPVRAAFGQMKDGSFHIDWVFCCDPSARKHYSFPSPLDNDEKNEKFMAAPPTADTPGAEEWNAVTAIGGGPMLVQDSKDVAMENYWKECLDSGGTAGASHVPRTGIGLDKDGNPIVIVCDGRSMKGSYGLTLSELARTFIQHGAVVAMNLDGGGSSALVGKGGELLNWPSDSGSSANAIERKVVSSIAFSLELK